MGNGKNFICNCEDEKVSSVSITKLFFAKKRITSEIYYLIPFFGLSGRLLSFDDVFVNGIAEMESTYLRRCFRDPIELITYMIDDLEWVEVDEFCPVDIAW